MATLRKNEQGHLSADEFEVEVKKDPFGHEGSMLSITHNGY